MFESIPFIKIGPWLGGKIAGKGFDEFVSKLKKNDNINKKFYKSVEVVSRKLQIKYPDVLGGSIDYFFKNEDVFKELFKLLFKSSNVNLEIISSNFDNSTLPNGFILEFIESLKIELEKDRELNEIISDKEIFVLLKGLDENIYDLSKNTSLTLSELQVIKDMIKQRLGNIFSFDEFYNIYKENTLNNLSQINFIGLGVDASIRRNRKYIQDVFVSPNFTKNEINSTKESISIDNDNFISGPYEQDITDNYSDLFYNHNKIVVLGNPGSGKSLLVNSIICDILKKNNSFKNETILNHIPFKIELRKYLSFKKIGKGGLLKYCIFLLETEYSIHNITQEILDDIFKNKQCLLFFDGLDEIFKIEDKISIKNDIENFHNLYKKIKSLTTSRIIGYQDAKLNEENFSVYTILKFNDIQINDYINKWYNKEEENIEIRQKEINGFLSKKDEIDIELISNPLLLSLIVILYRNTLKLPESKLDIYQSCTKTLVDKWDASKALEIDIEQNIYKEKDKILADLAYWQYEQLSSESLSITYEKAKKTVALTLKDRLKIADDFNCEDQADSFLSYAQKRSIYFDNNFTHKTFLEYYAAYWIYSNIEKKHKIQERNNIISKYISNPFWHIVLELLLNMIDKDQADSEIMDSLIEYQIIKNPHSFPFILSTITSFRNIGIQTISDTISTSINYLLKPSIANKRNYNVEEGKLNKIQRSNSLEDNIFRELSNFYHFGEKTNSLLLECLIKIENNCKSSNEFTVLYALYLEILLDVPNRNDVDFNFELSNKKMFDTLVKENSYLHLLIIYIKTYQKPNSYIDEILSFIDNFGKDQLFYFYEGLFESVRFAPLIRYYLGLQLRPESLDKMDDNIQKLEAKGVSKANIISFLTNKGDRFGFLIIDTTHIIDKIEKEKNKEIIILLLLLLFSGNHYPYEINNFYGKNNEALFLKLYNIKDREKRVKEIMSIQ